MRIDGDSLAITAASQEQTHEETSELDPDSLHKRPITQPPSPQIPTPKLNLPLKHLPKPPLLLTLQNRLTNRIPPIPNKLNIKSIKSIIIING